MTPSAWLARVSLVAGSIGLLGIMVIDSAAVIGRHIGVPLLGSIELCEALIVVMASASLIGTTLERGHASVHILTERLGEHTRRWLRRATDLSSAFFCATIAVGSAWIAVELWGSDEQSELLGIPLGPLRLLLCVSAVGLVLAFVTQALARRGPT